MNITLPFRKLSEGDTPRPWLPVTIINPSTNQKLNILGLIDTGADECALPSSYASIVGHDLKRGIKKQIATGNGVTTAYSHTMKIQLDDFITQDVLIDFLQDLNTPLLGVKSFLSNFILTVDYPKGKFSIEK